MKTRAFGNSRTNGSRLFALSAALLAGPWLSVPAFAGAYIFAGETYGVDLILHPQGYTGTQSVLDIEVCIDSSNSSVPSGASSLADVEQSVRNIVAIWNQMQPTVGNTLLFSNNNIPDTPVFYDFESVALHELGHCIGLAHVNAASESGLTGADQNYTKATDGINNSFDLNAGVDGVRGSRDDQRSDDVNLHWFRTDTNDPGQLPLPVPVDNTTYDRDQSSLPAGDNFAANLDRAVAGLLGYPNTSTVKTEAVMQQGSFNDEDQRRLTADGVATVLLGMSGIDEIAGTADDYVINLSYGGIKADPTGCDLDIRLTGTSFAFCSVSGGSIATNHWRIGPNRYMQFGPMAVNWFFNQTGACRQSLDLVTGQWKQMALSCAPAIGANTVLALLADDLSGIYDVDWVVYERDAITDSYNKLLLTDTMEVGRGYWIKTNQASQSVNIETDFNVEGDFALESDASGRYNLAGHRYWYDEAWADVLVVDPGNPSSPLSLAQADPAGACQGANPLANGCVMSRIAYKWNGAAYESFDGQTLGMEGTLENFDGFFVKAYKSGISLRIPDQKSTPSAPHSDVPLQNDAGASAASASVPSRSQAPGWYVRLIVESGDLRDAGNVLGQLPDSVGGYDSHDLIELAPFGDQFLTIVFPHENWGEHAGDYTSDFRGFDPAQRAEVWEFEVRASDAEMDVTLSWQSSDAKHRFRSASLLDLETGQSVPVSAEGSYNFRMGAEVRRFRWVQSHGNF